MDYVIMETHKGQKLSHRMGGTVHEYSGRYIRF